MSPSTLPIRFVYRSQSMIPLLTIVERAGIWADEGIQVEHTEFSDDPIGAEEDLFAGKIDFIFGNHISPYMRIARGFPMVCLAQTENWTDIWVATRQDIISVQELAGKRLVSRPMVSAEGKFIGHGDANRLLQLEVNGVKLDTLNYVDPEGISNPAEMVREMEADACFVAPERLDQVKAAGLRVHELPPLAMVHSTTLTTTIPRTEQDDLMERVIRVLLRATHFLKTRKPEVLELWKNPISKFRPGQYDKIVQHYDETLNEYEDNLYPRAEAILHAHRIACMVYPEAAQINPLQLWDLHPLRKVLASGFPERLREEALVAR